MALLATLTYTPATRTLTVVEVEPPVVPAVTSVSVTPATAAVVGGATQAFAALVVATPGVDQAVTWTLTGPGDLDEDGLYTAPIATSAVQLATVTATSVFDEDQTGTASITIPAIVVTAVTEVVVSPATGTVIGGTTQPFTAEVFGTGAPSQAVTWGASVGSISASGLYTAPAATATPQVVEVSATSVANPAFVGTATITIPAATAVTVRSVVVAPATATVNGGGTQAFTATVTGTNNPSTAVTWLATGGTITAAGLLTVPASTTAVQRIAVRALSVADATVFGQALVEVPALPLPPVVPPIVIEPLYALWRFRPGGGHDVLATRPVPGGVVFTPSVDGVYLLRLVRLANDEATPPILADQSPDLFHVEVGSHREAKANAYDHHAARNPKGHPLDDVLRVISRVNEARACAAENNPLEADTLLAATFFPR